jgi:ABC-type sugar transport system permease subunit
MWIVGSIIFAIYMYFTIWNINNGVKPPAQREDASYDVMDMDGMGNFSRFPTDIKVTKCFLASLIFYLIFTIIS